MKFFTDKTVVNDYLLIKIMDYLRLKKKGEDFSKWKEVFIDLGVYDLKDKYGGRISCRKNNRQEFFDEYMKIINSFL